MLSAEFPDADPDADDGLSDVHCDECRSAIQSDGSQSASFLLLDQLTIPVLSCDDHLEQFASLCGLTSEDAAELLDHYPAGGVRCPGCRHARYDAAHPMIPVHGGAVVVTACPDHQSAIVDRFRTGLRTRERLTTGLDVRDASL